MIESLSEFESMMLSDDQAVRERVRREQISDSVVHASLSAGEETRVAIVTNKSIGPDALRLFATDPEWRVRTLLVMRKNADADLLQVLSNDEEENIRIRVAQHRNVGREVLLKLSNDPSSLVREAALKALAT